METKLSKNEMMAKANVIFEVWTAKWGLKVYPAYGIDKLKFSFIEVGAKGNGKSFDIYMATEKDGADCFDNWAYDILHGQFQRQLEKEEAALLIFPKAYLYVTGEKRDKCIGIMNSTKGNAQYCIYANVDRNDGERRKAYIPVSAHDLRRLVERYKSSYATRKKELEFIRQKAEKAQAQWYQNAAIDEPSVSEDAEASTDEVVPKGERFTFYTQGEGIVKDDVTIFSVKVDGYKQLGKLVFSKDSNVAWLGKLLDAAKSGERVLEAYAIRNGSEFVFQRSA